MAHVSRLGLIVNPVAGMGGRVGLKGTDGEETLAKAKELGARPVSPARTIEALKEINKIADQIELVTCPLEMGQEEALSCGFHPTVIDAITKGKSRTFNSDTQQEQEARLPIQ